MAPRDELDCDVVVVGGGPGGAAIARLLALTGLQTIVLESASAIREQYRAELIQPSSATVLEATGVAPELLAHGYRIAGMEVFGRRRRFFRVDYAELGEGISLLSIPIRQTRSILLSHDAPPGMSVRLGAKVNGLITEDGVVRGVTYRGPDGEPVTVRARLVVGADGRSSTVRKQAGIEADHKRYSVQIVTMNGHSDDAWLNHLRLHVHSARFMALAPAPGGNVRMAWAIPLGAFPELRKQPIETLVRQLIEHVPYTEPWARQVDSWDKVHLQPLDTAFAHEWARDGLLLIGDAAHAVSPFGGQGLNMALHDALIATPLISEALRSGPYPAAQVLGRLQELRSRVCKGTLAGGDAILTVFGPRFPQPVRETAMTIGGKLRGPNRFLLPRLALGTTTVREHLAAARTAFDALAAGAATVPAGAGRSRSTEKEDSQHG
jgi:monooxygenase